MSGLVPEAAVLFDLDGTLADTCHDLASAACDALAAIGLSAPDPLLLHPYGSRGGRGMLRAGWTGSFDEQAFQAAFQVFLERYAHRMYENTKLYDGIAETIAHLTRVGRPWGIVTNKGQRYTRPLIEHLGLRPQVLVCGDMVPQAKPAPDGLLAATAVLGREARACVHVGDDGKDVAAARAAGMPSIAALYGYSWRLDDPTLRMASALVTEPRELVEALRQIDAAAQEWRA